MKKRWYQGFTIIETMLFLAVTGLLVMAILVGSTSAIGRQRYRDSANDLHSFLQEQYSNVLNTSNQRNNLAKCDNGGVDDSGGGVGRGQTDCVLLGKFIYINIPNADKLTVADIYGYSANPEQATTLDEINIFKSSGYNIKTLLDSEKEYSINWGVKVSSKNGGNFKPFSLLIVRSPNSGDILTFFNESHISDPQNLVNTGNLKEGVICLSPEGLFPDSEKMAIKIDSRAASTGAVNLVSGESTCQ